MNRWNDRSNLQLFAILETKKSDGKCGIVMTGFNRHVLTRAMSKMILKRKLPRTTLEIIEFSERAQ